MDVSKKYVEKRLLKMFLTEDEVLRYLVGPFRNVAFPHSTSVQNKITLCPYRRSVIQRSVVRYP